MTNALFTSPWLSWGTPMTAAVLIAVCVPSTSSVTRGSAWKPPRMMGMSF